MESFYGLDLEEASIMSIYNPLNRSRSPGYISLWLHLPTKEPGKYSLFSVPEGLENGFSKPIEASLYHRK